MNNNKISIKRMLELENLEVSDNSKFSKEELEYIRLALKIPFKEMQLWLDFYDNSTPKLDELKFISSLERQYSETRENIIKRIKQVRKLIKYKNKKKIHQKRK